MNETYLGAILCLNNGSGTILESSSAFKRLMGYSSEILATQFDGGLFNLVPVTWRARVVEELNLQLEDNAEFFMDFPLETQSSGAVWVHFFGAAMEQGRDRVLRGQLINVDRYYRMITAHQQILDSLNSPVMLLDTPPSEEEIKYHYVNSAAQGQFFESINGALLGGRQGSQGSGFPEEFALDLESKNTFGGHDEDMLERLRRGAPWALWNDEKGRSFQLKIDKHRDVLGNVLGYIVTGNPDPDEDSGPKKQLLAKEHQYLVSLMSNTVSAFEVNLSSDIMIHVENNPFADIHNNGGSSYTQFLRYAVEQYVHPAYSQYIMDTLCRKVLLKAFKEGKREVRCEYQRLDNGNNMTWVCTTAYIIQSPENGDICALCTVRDIDSQKRWEAELQNKAEHDPLTGLYNRATAMIKINAALDPGLDKISALFMLDVDDFKGINDTYGHLYGDAVLSELAQKLRVIFRKEDVLGRMGGDEFLVFLNDISSETIGIQKAEAICQALRTVYSSSGKACKVSGSIGVAFSPKDGCTFQELYAKADIALYTAKKLGKNRYSVYTEEQGEIILSHTTEETFSRGKSIEKSFSENISEYIFKILYYTPDLNVGLPAVLELFGKHCQAEHCFIFYRQPNDRFSMLYEWAHPDTVPQKDDLKCISWESLANWSGIPSHKAGELVHGSLSPSETQILTVNQDLRSMLHCPIVLGGKLMGFLGIAQYASPSTLALREFSHQEKLELRSAAEIIGVFLKSDLKN